MLMDPELRDLICRTWRILEEIGADEPMCFECTVRVILLARPEMDFADAKAAVRFVLKGEE